MNTLDEAILRRRRIDPASADQGFYRLIPGAQSPAAAPLILIPDSGDEPWANGWHSQVAEAPPIGSYLIDGLLVGEGGYMFVDGAPIFQSDVVVPYIGEFIREADFVDRSKLGDKPIVQIDVPTIVGFDRGYKTYGHVLIDILPRLIIAAKTFPDELGVNILIPADLPQWALSMMAIALGDQVKFTSVDFQEEHVLLRRAIVPTHIHNYYRFHPYASRVFDEMFDRSIAFRSATTENGQDKLFLSRKRLPHYSNRALADIDEIESYARSVGFHVVSPEAHSWPDQLAMFADASVVIGEYGSALHNTIFCKEGHITLSLGRLQFLQSFLGALNRQRIGYLLPRLETNPATSESAQVISITRARNAIDHVLSLRA